MCGILAYTSDPIIGVPTLSSEALAYLNSAIDARGPDHSGSISLNGINIRSSVLSLRAPFTAQPVQDGKTVLAYNGQLFDIGHNINDTLLFKNMCDEGRFQELQQIEGEFAFAYYTEDSLVFGRDRLGRRSLLYKLDRNQNLVVSSVASTSLNFTECQAGGTIYKYSFKSKILETIQLEVPKLSVTREIGTMENAPSKVLAALKNAVSRRLVRPAAEHKLALLFSGGIDCSILAALLDDVMPPKETIDLLNVAFENRRTQSLYDTPDRLLARRSLRELQARSAQSSGRFRLVEIDVPYEKYLDEKGAVQDLIAPSSTVMDLSIGIAFYFASRKVLLDSPNAKILISGLGADELFAGYSRHTSAAAAGPVKLAQELEEDFLRLPYRNLGRDDRVCASQGREVRYPFLDDEVVQLASQLPLNYKTDGKNTKIVLREVGKMLNFTDIVNEKKRAIQFGARSAKIDPGSGRSKGHLSLQT